MQVGIKFSTAIHALLCVEFFKNEKVTGEFIASSINTNPVIVRRLMQTLKSAGLITTSLGVGGIKLTKEPRQITLLDVFNAVNDAEKNFQNSLRFTKSLSRWRAYRVAFRGLFFKGSKRTFR